MLLSEGLAFDRRVVWCKILRPDGLDRADECSLSLAVAVNLLAHSDNELDKLVAMQLALRVFFVLVVRPVCCYHELFHLL